MSSSVSSEFQTLGQNLQSLRQVKGHWDGGDSDPRVDNFNGEKHQTLQKLGEYFGKPGTPAAHILSTMGQPDEVKQTMGEEFHASLMPGPVIGGAGAAALGANSTGDEVPQVLFFVYKWRGNHDYLWFKIDATTEQVLESSWYHAYE